MTMFSPIFLAQSDEKGSTIVCTVKRGLITAIEINAKTERISQLISKFHEHLIDRPYSDFFLAKPTDLSSLVKDIM